MFWWKKAKCGIELKGSVRHEQETVPNVLEACPQNEATTIQIEEPLEQNVRRSTRTRTELTRLTGYERFLDQAIRANGDPIEEVMMMAESEPINLDQAMNDSNWLAAMK